MIKDKLLVEDEADRYGRNKITATYKSVKRDSKYLFKLIYNHKNFHKLIILHFT